ncbi:MAG: hypothetical protein AAF485_06875 [Chloroflexota bacterium]
MVGDVALLLGRYDIATYVLHRLKDWGNYSILGGVLNPAVKPEQVDAHIHSPSTREKLEKAYPLYQRTMVVDRLQRFAEGIEEIALCLDHQYEAALEKASLADSERSYLWVIGTQAVIGDIDAALEIINTRMSADFRREALTTIVTELCYRGEFDKAVDIINRLERQGIVSGPDPQSRVEAYGVIARFELAPAFIGRIVDYFWWSYPYGG